MRFTQPVALVAQTVTGRNSLGQPTYSETLTGTVGAFAPGGSAETLNSSDTVVDQPTVYLPVDTDVTAVDAVIIEPALDDNGDPVAGTGVRYDVDGDPKVWVSPFTRWAPGVEVRLRRVTG